MKAKIAINGFGRIGRFVLRRILEGSFLEAKNCEVVAINDVVSSDTLAYLFKYDSVHGAFPGTVTATENELIINGHKIRVYNERDPAMLPWKDIACDYVIESTGLFTKKEGAEKHIQAGARRVIISAPTKSADVRTFVYGVNHHTYDPKNDHILSNASCTTNCLAPLCKVLQDSFGIEEGLMTTIHAATATQAIVDMPSPKDRRSGRSALLNIIPASTGAAKAVTLCLPELQGKLTGMAFRVPVANVSCVDLTVRLKQKTSYEAICNAMEQQANGPMKGILAVTDEAVVSTDFNGSLLSTIFDKTASFALNESFYKLIAWYDNEMGYSQRIVDILSYIATKDGF